MGGDDFEGKRILVTDSSGELGLALVREFTARGGTVLATARNAEGIARVLDDPRIPPSAVRVHRMDVTDETSIRNAAIGRRASSARRASS